MPGPYDIAVVGGGINGAGIARDAAGRGLRVLLVEAGDLGSATSSASSKLIHGGLRYLEHGELRLVAEALAEREVLLALAPHIVRPLEFVLPHEPHLRPFWLIRLGLLLYDRLGASGSRHGRRMLHRSRSIQLRGTDYGRPLQPRFERGFSYYDCRVDDARLVVLNARSAAQHGAEVLPRTRLVAARRANGLWQLGLADRNGHERTVTSRTLVNAAGPWVASVLSRIEGARARGRLRLVRGSHIVVPAVDAADHAYVLQHRDRRIVFLIPFEGRFTLVGTTDVAVDETALPPEASQQEIDYLCAAASSYLSRPISPADVVWSFSGVRQLHDDGKRNPSAVTRDYHLDLDAGSGGEAPLLSVFGGKITTYRRLAEEVLRRLAPWLPPGAPWTDRKPLPGGDFPPDAFDRLVADIRATYPDIPAAVVRSLAGRHGTETTRVLGNARTVQDLGRSFGGGLYEAEARWCIEHEWALEAEDILWRRTRCGLHMTAGERATFRSWMAAVYPARSAAVTRPT